MYHFQAIHTGQSLDLSNVDWAEAGGAQELFDLFERKWITVKKVSGELVDGVFLHPVIPSIKHNPGEEGLPVWLIQFEKYYREYIKEVPSGIRAAHEPKLVLLRDINTIEVRGEPRVAVSGA